MAKRAPLLDESFNPVASRLERYKRETKQPPAETPEDQAEDAAAVDAVAETGRAVEELPRRAIAPHRELPKQSAPAPLSRPLPPQEPRAEPEPEPVEIHEALEAMTSSLRARVTETERKHYTDLALWLTGKQNQFSSLARALLILLEHAQGELEKRLPELHKLERPSPKDRLAMALYEYKLAEVFWDCIDAAGRLPRQSRPS